MILPDIHHQKFHGFFPSSSIYWVVRTIWKLAHKLKCMRTDQSDFIFILSSSCKSLPLLRRALDEKCHPLIQSSFIWNNNVNICRCYKETHAPWYCSSLELSKLLSIHPPSKLLADVLGSLLPGPFLALMGEFFTIKARRSRDMCLSLRRKVDMCIKTDGWDTHSWNMPFCAEKTMKDPTKWFLLNNPSSFLLSEGSLGFSHHQTSLKTPWDSLY